MPPSLGVSCLSKTASQSSGSNPVGESMPSKLYGGTARLAWGPRTEQKGRAVQPAAAWTLSHGWPDLVLPGSQSLADTLSFDLAPKCPHPT